MVIAIIPMEQWTGVVQTDRAVYLDLPAGIDPDKEVANVYYGQNPQILIEHFLNLGAKIVDNPVKTYHV